MKFEEALNRIEKIVKRIETEDIPLEEALVLYEEGMELVSFCKKQLDEASFKIATLSKQGSSFKKKIINE
jgi:exodeoxyribonuclease VII small subunit